ncbi:hypothetical protein Nepgr_011617 [Nepenthes gracilis]|uniref:Uncharacterized protein n=1 Tax=Nepenthes gracilis TaxID=150966 RepID=A0AAD3SFU7_NEPGR|nr:hypothetical protein Nepgr_011617 [Nepenthes gracilis]
MARGFNFQGTFTLRLQLFVRRGQTFRISLLIARIGTGLARPKGLHPFSRPLRMGLRDVCPGLCKAAKELSLHGASSLHRCLRFAFIFPRTFSTEVVDHGHQMPQGLNAQMV